MGNILVTGADGFIGKRLVIKLKDLGYTVLEHTIHDGDIASTTLDFQDVDHVFHLAGLTYVPYSWENPSEFYRVNVMGTQNVLEFCRKNDASLTFPSTYVYGAPITIPISERHPVNPNTPYNHSKVLCESLCEFYNKVFKIDITVLRPFNIFGAGQSPEFLIPTVINQIINQDVKEIIVKDLLPKRDYLYVDDLVEAMCITVGNKGYRVYNVGSGSSLSVEEVILSIQKISGIFKPYLSLNARRTNEVDDIIADITKIKSELNWRPKYSWNEAISLMIKDILNNNNNGMNNGDTI